jgi:hypothetical protein
MDVFSPDASHFNRVSIVELGVVAVVITMMIGMHHF